MTVPGAILTPWSPKVKGLLTNFMPGQQCGNAITDVLYGVVNPGAKLPLTFPNKARCRHETIPRPCAARTL